MFDFFFYINEQIGFIYSDNANEQPKEEANIKNMFQSLDLNENDLIEPVEIDGSLKGQTLFH